LPSCVIRIGSFDTYQMTGIDPNRSFTVVGVNGSFLIAKRPFDCPDQLGG